MQYTARKGKGILPTSSYPAYLLVASVGCTQEQLKQQGTAYKVGSFSFEASARASMDADGFVMKFRASAQNVARMPHAHPTCAKARKKACLAATRNRTIHR